MNGIPIGKGLFTARRLPPSPEANRSDVSRYDIACQRSPVGDPEDDEKWSDALFVIIVE